MAESVRRRVRGEGHRRGGCSETAAAAHSEADHSPVDAHARMSAHPLPHPHQPTVTVPTGGTRDVVDKLRRWQSERGEVTAPSPQPQPQSPQSPPQMQASKSPSGRQAVSSAHHKHSRLYQKQATANESVPPASPLTSVSLSSLLAALGVLLLAYVAAVVAVILFVDSIPDRSTFPWHTPTIVMLCVASMHAIKLVVHLSSSRGRAKVIVICVVINSICTLSYAANASGLLGVRIDTFGRQLVFARFLEWIFTTPLLVMLVASLSDYMMRADATMLQFVPLKLLAPPAVWYERVEWVTAADLAMLGFGAAAGLADDRPSAITCALISAGFFVWTVYGLDRFLQHTERCCTWLLHAMGAQTLSELTLEDAQSRAIWIALHTVPSFRAQQEHNVVLLRGLRIWMVLSWSVFPTVFVISCTHLISDFAEESLYLFGDIVAKVLFLTAIQYLNIGALENGTDVRAMVEREQHQRTQARVKDIEAKHAALKMDTTAKDAFLRYVLHEIRIPLNSLVLGVDHLAEMDLSTTDASVPATVRTMAQAAAFIPHLLDDVLSLQKITSGSYELADVVGSLQHLVLTSVVMLTASAQAKNVSIVWYVDSSVPLIIADVPLLRQVVANLLSNAVKFSPTNSQLTLTMQRVPTPEVSHSGNTEHVSESPPRGAITSTRSMTVAPDETGTAAPTVQDSSTTKRWYRFAVRDQGNGISAHDQGMLFQPFVQIDAEKEQGGKGSGLGLSICKRIIELFGGRVGVQSEVGCGSEFFFEAPLNTASESQALQSDFREAAAAAADGSTSLRDGTDTQGKTWSVISTSIANDLSTIEHTSTPVTIRDVRPPHAIVSSLGPAPVVVPVEMSWPREHTRRTLSAGVTMPGLNQTDLVGSAPSTPASSSIRTPSSTEASALAAVLRGRTSPARILLVDDVETNRTLLQRLLSRQGFHVDVAHDGEECIEYVQRDPQRYDCILMGTCEQVDEIAVA